MENIFDKSITKHQNIETTFNAINPQILQKNCLDLKEVAFSSMFQHCMLKSTKLISIIRTACALFTLFKNTASSALQTFAVIITFNDDNVEMSY